MNQAFAGATALIITALLVALGRKPRQSLPNESAVSLSQHLKSSQSVLVQSGPIGVPKNFSLSGQTKIIWQQPTNIQERLELQKYLAKAMNQEPEKRLKAIEIAKIWGHSSVLPLLKRGLRDSDSRVVVAAASAMEGLRGKPSSKAASSTSQDIRPPRNVARMR